MSAARQERLGAALEACLLGLERARHPVLRALWRQRAERVFAQLLDLEDGR